MTFRSGGLLTTTDAPKNKRLTTAPRALAESVRATKCDEMRRNATVVRPRPPPSWHTLAQQAPFERDSAECT